jgi:hypothetical protein
MPYILHRAQTPAPLQLDLDLTDNNGLTYGF